MAIPLAAPPLTFLTEVCVVPIRPENRARYPADWLAIRTAIVARAANRCEGSPAWPFCRAANGEPHPVTGARVVLTVAHLDHTPENCTPANLRAWCQRCHNTYDAPHRARNRTANRGTKPCAS
jgi:5-methylcytosine-specific restriction endonuclease McrA